MEAFREQTNDGHNAAMNAMLDMYNKIEIEYMQALENTGIVFSAHDADRNEARSLLSQLEAAGARIRNAGASVVLGTVSRACVACTGACSSRTYAITNNCHRDCFFCFNPNERNFAYYCEHDFPWRKQIDELVRDGIEPICLALSGGEPMLMPEKAYVFYEYAASLFPNAHLRLYTSGDLLDQGILEKLRAVGLDEIRFSVKMDDPVPLRAKVLENILLAKDHIPTVMVEMPVIPGTEEQMKDLLLDLDEIGINGINLLEFTYPMWNWPAYESRGLTLRNPPFRVFFDYLYAGTLAVQGSEESCLKLMLWAHRQNLHLGMHYCSLENKHRAQMRQLNRLNDYPEEIYAFDYGDYFLKTAIVFGLDRAPVRRALRKKGCADFLEDDEAESTSFHPCWLETALKVRHEGGEQVQPCISYNVMVTDGGEVRMRELKIEDAITAPPIQFEDLTSASDQEAKCGLT